MVLEVIYPKISGNHARRMNSLTFDGDDEVLLVPAVPVGHLAGELPRVLRQHGLHDEPRPHRLAGGLVDAHREPGVAAAHDVDAVAPPEDVHREVAGGGRALEHRPLALAHRQARARLTEPRRRWNEGWVQSGKMDVRTGELGVN